jgi:hypothetical protein
MESMFRDDGHWSHDQCYISFVAMVVRPWRGLAELKSSDCGSRLKGEGLKKSMKV